MFCMTGFLGELPQWECMEYEYWECLWGSDDGGSNPSFMNNNQNYVLKI